MDDDQLADPIRAEGIDILVDLSMHAPGNRLPMFARHPAPRPHGAVVSLTIFERDAGALGRARHIVDLLKPQAASVALNLLSEGPPQPAWQLYYTEPKLCQWLLSQRRKK